MHSTEHLGPKVIFSFGDGRFFISETVIWALIVSITLIVLALWSTRRLEKIPKGGQIWAEAIVSGIYKLVSNIMGPNKAKAYFPYVGTLFIFLMISNALGLLGFRPVTTDPNTTFALSIITFFMIIYASIKAKGIGGHFRHYIEPFPFMVPIKIIEEVSFPISLAFRCFGNITGGAIVMALTFQCLGYLSHLLIGWIPVLGKIPILAYMIPLPLNFFFDMFEPVLQAFIFTMLTMAFIGVHSATHDE